MKTIFLTGGGTGGHVIPHLSLLKDLENTFDKIVYLGSKNGIEYEIISQYKNIIFEDIPVVKLQRDKKLKNLLLPFKLAKSIGKSKKIINKYKPDIIFSKGGFVSVPVCLAGKLKKVPIVSHESDLTLGLANKIIYKVCDIFCTTFEETSLGKSKAVCTGSPIREQLFKGSKQKGFDITKFNNNNKTILITGGSTGATALNDVVFKALPLLTKKYNVVHLVGKNKKNNSITSINYCQLEYCNNIEDLFCIADVVVSRAGSNAIYELLALKKPMLLIPLPKGASRGDQVDNAKYFEKKKYAKVLLQEDLTPKTLLQNVDELLANKESFIQNMTMVSNQSLTNGSKNIFDQIQNLLSKKK